MRVILQKDIPNLGEAGDIINVKNGYARNYLFPNNFVIPATDSNESQKKHQNRLIRLKKEKRAKMAATMADAFKELVCEFPVRVGAHGKLYGSITALDIAENLSRQGYDLDKRKVILGEPIKMLGEYEIRVKLGEGMESTIKVRVSDTEGNISAAPEPENELSDNAAPDIIVADPDENVISDLDAGEAEIDSTVAAESDNQEKS